MGEANQGSGREWRVSHSAILTQARRAARTRDFMEFNSGGFQAMTGKVQCNIPRIV